MRRRARAAGRRIQLSYSNCAFQPSEVRAPAGKSVLFRIKNHDAKAMEFEKQIAASGESRCREE
jgi:plastocyanin